MATFSYFQHFPHSLLDPLLVHTPYNSSIKLSSFEEESPLCSLLNTSTIEDTSLNPFLDLYNVDITNKTATKDSFSGNQLSHIPYTTSAGKNRRRKTIYDNNSKEKVEGRKGKKQRNGSSSYVKEKRASEQEAPKDYIHVRARRGQATNTHSLAERVRREKIGERMRILQDLVPGCNKVTGKALMLDEIINYVKSLQNQVEVLSMKLASISPLDCDFGLDLGGLMHGTEMGSTEIETSFANEMPTTTPLFPSLLDEFIVPTKMGSTEVGMSFASEMPTTTPLFPSLLDEFIVSTKME